MLITKARSLAIAVVFCVLMSGCTARDLYFIGQERQREQCRSGPPSNFDRCMKQANESFEAYQRNKNEVDKNR